MALPGFGISTICSRSHALNRGRDKWGLIVVTSSFPRPTRNTGLRSKNSLDQSSSYFILPTPLKF